MQVRALQRLGSAAHVALTCSDLQTARAIDALVAKLAAVDEHSMVRHEAAEALGAIATAECIPVLELYAADACREVAETCQLAVRRIQYWREKRAAAAPAALTAPCKGSRKETFAIPRDEAPAPCVDGSESAFLSGAAACAGAASRLRKSSRAPRLVRSGPRARGSCEHARARAPHLAAGRVRPHV
jgi:hypothetical protein